jgi:hypothetical protein
MSDSNRTAPRRTVLAGAGAVGALAAAASLLPAARPAADAAQAPSQDAAAPGASAGYRLTEHVKRYYATARI